MNDQVDDQVNDQANDQPNDQPTDQANDPVLSKDEVGALLEGVESGEVEVHSASGPHLASVRPFELPSRSRLATKRYPRLEQLNERLAECLTHRVEHALQCSVGLSFRETVSTNLESLPERTQHPIVAVQFSATPLKGDGALLLEADLLNQLVERYFGGETDSASAKDGRFTAGEIRVAESFCRLILDNLKDVWQPFLALEPALVKTESGLALLDIAADSAMVLKSSFDISFAERDSAVHLVMPHAMLEAHLQYLKGIDRTVDPARDQAWSEVIRTTLTDIGVGLTATVGNVEMSLRDLVRLAPGDVIPIDDPKTATIHAQGVPLIQARFGVHAGRNAVEARRWLGRRK